MVVGPFQNHISYMFVILLVIVCDKNLKNSHNFTIFYRIPLFLFFFRSHDRYRSYFTVRCGIAEGVNFAKWQRKHGKCMLPKGLPSQGCGRCTKSKLFAFSLRIFQKLSVLLFTL